MVNVKAVLALPKGFHLVGFEKRNDVLTVTLVSTQMSPCCPLCGSAARRVHSCYTRQVADLPCTGQSIRLLIHVRKYFCEESTCPRKIFAERLTPFVDPFARVTKRLFQIVQLIGLATGGRLGVRVTDHLGIQTSRQTILRRIMVLPTEPVGQVSQIGIDDFAFRRGRRFGTIIVDLQTHQVLDVLPDRTKDSATAWMTAHPKLELVSRDRGGDYAAAARKAVPHATQTAIVEQVGISHSTVSRWLQGGTFPEQQPRPRKTGLEPYLPFLRERWDAGCHNIAQLYRELVACGYPQSYRSVYKHLVRLLPEGRQNAVKGSDLAPPPPLTARSATFLFLRRLEELDGDEQHALSMLRHPHPDIELAYNLVQQFAQMLRTRTGEQLDNWICRVRASHIRELQGFVRGIERDKAAVVAGLTLPQNNGLVEGKVNKLKLLKRMGYGRAGFPLLRQRMLHAL
jgi:transposase